MNISCIKNLAYNVVNIISLNYLRDVSQTNHQGANSLLFVILFLLVILVVIVVVGALLLLCLFVICGLRGSQFGKSGSL